MPNLKHPPRNGRNRLVDALPPADRDSLLSKTKRVSLEVKQMLYEVNEPIREAFFPLSGVASMVATLEDGSFLEVGTIGNEGVVGVPIFLGANRIPFRAFYQVPGEALRIDADVLKEEIARRRALQDILQRYLQALFTQLAQSVACNRLHSIEQRFARWMLMTLDRVESDEFPIRQEFIAMMLGATPDDIMRVAASFQAAGVIDYDRQVMEILNPAALQRHACECYRIIKDEYDSFLSDQS